MMPSLRKLVASLLIVGLLLATACMSAPPSRFESAQQESTQRGATAVSEEAVKGGSLNQFFPRSEDGYQVVYTQEKKGFSEAKLKQSGQDLAVLSISDTENNPTAKQKFIDSSTQIKGYPSTSQGSTGTAVLVGDRFQVKVLSRDPGFGEADRIVWLEKFDLDRLAQLQ